MKFLSSFSQPALSLRRRIKQYQEVAKDLQSVLSWNPGEWGRYQNLFNAAVNDIFREMMEFEKESLAKGDEGSVYKLKRLFTNRLRKEFLRGEYITWSFKKPYGYSGDFQIIDFIYQNRPATQGFERLYDNYFMMSHAPLAVRNRKEDFKRLMLNFVSGRPAPVKILDLASGPCRDVHEVLLELGPRARAEEVSFHCYDSDEHAIGYAKRLLGPRPNVSFVKENAVRMGLKKDVERHYPSYDLIYSTGLFDYFDHRMAVRLVANLKKILNPGGLLAIANFRDKYSNPSFHFMEWVGDWNLVYRTEEEFADVFLESGFKPEDLSFEYEQQGVLMYCLARR